MLVVEYQSERAIAHIGAVIRIITDQTYHISQAKSYKLVRKCVIYTSNLSVFLVPFFNRAVFNSVSKVARVSFCIDLLRSVIGFKI